MSTQTFDNVFVITSNKYTSVDQEYKCFLSEFNRLTRIDPQNLTIEENLMLEMLVLFISDYQEKIDPVQSWVNPILKTYLLAA